MFKAKQIMNCSILSIDPDDTIDRAISLLIEHRISGLPVVDKAGGLVGVISEFDLLELICDCQDEKQTVSHYMSGDVCSVDVDADWVEVADHFRRTHMRRLPVTQNGKLVGIITRHDLIKTIQDLRRGVRKRTRNNARGSCDGSRKRQETINTIEDDVSLTGRESTTKPRPSGTRCRYRRVAALDSLPAGLVGGLGHFQQCTEAGTRRRRVLRWHRFSDGQGRR